MGKDEKPTARRDEVISCEPICHGAGLEVYSIVGPGGVHNRVYVCEKGREKCAVAEMRAKLDELDMKIQGVSMHCHVTTKEGLDESLAHM